jgi:hypothetical protein
MCLTASNYQLNASLRQEFAATGEFQPRNYVLPARDSINSANPIALAEVRKPMTALSDGSVLMGEAAAS